MKMMKKAAAMILSVCLTVPMFGTIVSAAQGQLMFSDPETKVGETVDVSLVVKTGGDAIGDADITMSYDTSALEFVSGDGVQADGSGNLTYSGSGTGSENELRTTLQFKALKAGDTTISVQSSKAYLYNDETLTLAEGSSAVKVDYDNCGRGRDSRCRRDNQYHSFSKRDRLSLLRGIYCSRSSGGIYRNKAYIQW